jgi:large subunit ribosomal protein L13
MINRDINKISISSKDVVNSWRLIDANGAVLGRLASDIAVALIGKDKVEYAPNLVTGDYVVVINVDKIVLTGSKMEQKEYFRHSGYPGGEKITKIKEVLDSKPELVIINAVKGMLPKNKLRDVMMKRLKVFSGSDHPYENELLNK